MTNGKKSLLTIVMSVVMALAIVAGCLSFVNTKTVNASSVAPTFETVEGAWIRTHEVEERFGIKFQIRMDSEEYNTFLATYSDVEFGMFIMPEDYRASKGEFTEANLFGNEVYCWEGNMVEGKTEILNMAQAEMPEVDGAYNYLEFAITNVKKDNTTRPFAGVGYIKYNDGESVKYVIDDNGAAAARSIAQVAQDAKAGELPESVVAVLDKILAVKPAVEVTADYNADAISTAVNALDYAIGEELDITAIAEENAPEGYKVDTENSTLVATIPAKGVASFAVKYVKDWSKVDFSANLVDNYVPNGGYQYVTGLVKEYHICTTSCGGWAYIGTSSYGINIKRNTGCPVGVEIDSDYITNAIANGYTKLNLTWKVSTHNPYPVLKSGTELSSISSFSCNSTSIIEEDGLRRKTYDLSNFVAGNVFVIENPIGGATLSLTNISFEDITKITGNIAGFAVDEGIVTGSWTASHGNHSLKNENDTTVFAVGRNLHGDLLFNTKYVQAMFAKGFNTIKLVFSVETSVTTWGRMYLGYYDASENKMVKFDDSFLTSYVKVDQTYPETRLWTITEEMYAKVDFANGDQLAICNLEPGNDQQVITMTITHLEFGNKWSFVDFSKNILDDYDNGDIFTNGAFTKVSNPGCNCWNQHLNIGYTIGDYSGKYIDMNYCNWHARPFIYFNDNEFVNAAIAQGYTKIQIVFETGKKDATPGVGTTDGTTYTKLVDVLTKTSEEVVASNDKTYTLQTYTFDISNKPESAYLAINLTSSNIEARFYIYGISFVK